jgi:predicted transposase YbfD/YdcC
MKTTPEKSSESSLDIDYQSLFETLQQLPDPRDTRGKRHNFAFVLCGVVLAVLAGRSRVSSIYRYIRNQIHWLRDITHMPTQYPISRAQLPRLLARVDWNALNTLVEQHVDLRIEPCQGTWVAIDGKTLRGTTSAATPHGECIVVALTHQDKTVLAHTYYNGEKESEIPAVRQLLEHPAMATASVTLDALHLNPQTTSCIENTDRSYIIGVKDNQQELAHQLATVACCRRPHLTQRSIDKAHGRIEERTAWFYDLTNEEFAPRWSRSGLHTLIVVQRQTTTLPSGTESTVTSYYVSNRRLASAPETTAAELFAAIRAHWSVESHNWLRDVTFNEDCVHTTHSAVATVMATVRTLALNLLRKARLTNFQEAIENFADSHELFQTFLAKVGFL